MSLLVFAGLAGAAGAGAAAGWWFGYGAGFTKAILGSVRADQPEQSEARVVGFGTLAVSDDNEGVA